MNISIIKNFFSLKSESIGFYISLLLHFLILAFAIGIPNFFDRPKIYVPEIIPIEIINVSDSTSIPKKELDQNDNKTTNTTLKQKKFNSSDIKEIQKAELKAKPISESIKDKEVSNMIKQDILIEKKPVKKIKLEKEKIILKENNIETIPTKKIKPKIKPSTQSEELLKNKKQDVIIAAKPKAKPKKEFSIASMLKDLRNEKSTQNIDKLKEEEKNIENISDEEKKVNENNFKLSISEIDLLRQQLSSCWIAPAGAVIEKGMTVKVSAKVQQNRRVYDSSVRIVDTNISKSNPFYGPITESAMRTLLNPDCIPLKLPKDKYNLWKNLTITFDYSIMKGY
tara:strand:- start:97 stop:1113 length:1017 start_codon:yes stop_codon:yes gene_type:complete